MADQLASVLAQALLETLPSDGSPAGNAKLRYALSAKLSREISDPEFEAARDVLIAERLAIRAKGRGGSLRRAQAAASPASGLQDRGDLVLSSQEDVAGPAKSRSNPKRGSIRRGDGDAGAPKLIAYRHDEKRINNPEVGMVTPDSDPAVAETRWRYDPHIDPALQFDVGRAGLERMIDDALASGDEAVMRRALEQLKRQAGPYLNWAGKAERTSFEVDTVSLHVHERIDPASILTAIRKRMTKSGGEKVLQEEMFQAWFERPLPYREAIEFYKHDRGWSNRLISGDSLLVMNSLLQKEGMAGQVQMIYFDPPYGIKYGSNFQAFVNKREVKDRKDEDLTQEPEMIKAFRDTWELGIHSYLTYLRDRLLLAKELLHESGSVFVQISDENLHHVKELLDEVYGPQSFCGLIIVKKTTGLTSQLLGAVADFVLWYAREPKGIKYHELFQPKDLAEEVKGEFSYLDETLGSFREVSDEEAGNPALIETTRLFRTNSAVSPGVRANTTGSFSFAGKVFDSGKTRNWKTTLPGMLRLGKVGRLTLGDDPTRLYKQYWNDFEYTTLNAIWSDLRSEQRRIYVVQTVARIIERCLLMTTDPGDLALDPTCGSGTTAFVAEKWGRRWITCDTSRVAVTLAKQRLMTASYDYYELRYPHEGLKGSFFHKSVPHVTLKSIANNPEIDEIWERLHPAVEVALAELNTALRKESPEPFEVREGGRKGIQIDFGAKASATVTLPSGESAAAGALLEWEVPFDFPEAWPPSARAAFEAVHKTRRAMQQQIDASIAAHAEQELLYDQPQVAKNKLRVTGPFTVEAVPFPSVLSLEEAGRQPPAADHSVARSGESARQHGWRDELIKTGIRGKGGQMLRFAELETLPGTRYVHCTGTLAESGERAVVSFGPEHAALEQRQVEMALREAGELFPRPKFIVFCAFTFDPEAAKDIDATKGITALKAQMNTDLLTEDLKKARASNQSFWLMGQPDVEVRKRKDGKYEVEVNGFDYFDTVKGELVSGGKQKIAAWSLDTDYDERSLFPHQVFFPMAGAKDGWHKLKKDIKAELNENALEKLHGTVSLPFEAGSNGKVAVKIVDDRGIESLKVMALP